ncbi:MAG: ssDNA-binding domain-containing protein [Anaerolineae bacterium]|nr:ssDNA-binding domain-containing protein [Anaerolineae bacterium]
MNIYEIVTKRILEQLEKGVIPWKMPYKISSGIPRNFATGKDYRGVNIFLLWCQNYESPYWLTCKQAERLKGSIREGETGTPVIYWNLREKDNPETGEVERMPLLRCYLVFNAMQTEGIAFPEGSKKTFFNPRSACENIVRNMPHKPKIDFGSSRACYRPKTDTVLMPDKDSFIGTAEYYSTLFHEMSHSTGHESRLKRKGITDLMPFGSKQYSKEELIAEMGAAFICGHVGIGDATLQNQAAYIAAWRKKLEEDSTILLQAAAQGQRAADYILGRTPEHDRTSHKLDKGGQS